MELTKELTVERIPTQTTISLAEKEGLEPLELNDDELNEKLIEILKERIDEGNSQARFQLGQLYFEKGDYLISRKYFEEAIEYHNDWQARFQLSVILYDCLDNDEDKVTREELHASMNKGLDLMRSIAESTAPSAQHLVRLAQYNLGRAYYQGFGTNQSDIEAEKWWLLAADDGNPAGSVRAQSTLGLYYTTPDHRDLKKSFFWHSEATGNGSLESQGALGMMYLLGMGTKADPQSAFICLREAAERGNIYALANLIAYYYKRKLFSKAVELAARLTQIDDPDSIAQDTNTLPSYCRKGLALASFYYGRMLHLGLGVKKDEKEAKNYYSKSFQFDPDVCAKMHASMIHGEI